MLQEVLLHETAVAWVRDRLALSMPKKPWVESREAYGARLRSIARDINANCDVDGLCSAFPSRVAELVARGGDRLSK